MNTKTKKNNGIARKLTSLILIAIACICAAAVQNSIQVVAADKAESEPVQIKTYNELAGAATHSDGNYILMADIDMSRAGAAGWKPWNFNGTFDGNGHTLYNMDVKSVTDVTAKTYDGNLKEYDTYFAGLFGITDGAVISNLNVAGAYIELGQSDGMADKSIFAAVIAGFMNNTTISNCNVLSSYVSLTSTSKMWGTGGIAGFGNGLIKESSSDVTLVCTDADPDDADKDEQFMGGIYADGYIDVADCTVNIDGYISERGYVHSGGIAGLYILYPVSGTYVADIAGNTVNGMITFFEDNQDRRAYCRAITGERMNVYTTSRENVDNFTRNEVYDYTKVLKPDNYERKTYAVDNPYESSQSDNAGNGNDVNNASVNGNNSATLSSGELIEGVNGNADMNEKHGLKIGSRVLFSGLSEAARVAIIIVIAIVAIGAYYIIVKHIRGRK